MFRHTEHLQCEATSEGPVVPDADPAKSAPQP
jgi:hypothetical protein